MRRLPMLVLLGGLVSTLGSREAAAQWNVTRFGTEKNRVYTTFGMDPALVTSVGYGRVIAVAGHDFQFAVDGGVVAAHFDMRDYRARLGLNTSLLHCGPLRLTGSATFITRGTENSIYRGFNWGSDITGDLGFYRRGWFAAGEFGFDKAIITHITNSDWYRKYFYPDAKDGWYLTGGGTYHYGAAAGVSLGRTELVGRFGWRETENHEPVTPPIYGSVGVGVGF